jgi:hypothetical protein
VCTTQLALGYTIIATVIPYLKPFMMAYEPPTPSRGSYYPSSSGTRFKLSNLTSRSSGTTSAAVASMNNEDDGTFRENNRPHAHQRSPQGERRNRPTLRVGRLRPDQTRYEVTASATDPGRQENSDHASDDSEQMIIKKGVEWSVKYNDGMSGRERGASVAGTEESRGTIPGPDDIMTIRDPV